MVNMMVMVAHVADADEGGDDDAEGEGCRDGRDNEEELHDVDDDNLTCD